MRTTLDPLCYFPHVDVKAFSYLNYRSFLFCIQPCCEAILHQRAGRGQAPVEDVQKSAFRYATQLHYHRVSTHRRRRPSGYRPSNSRIERQTRGEGRSQARPSRQLSKGLQLHRLVAVGEVWYTPPWLFVSSLYLKLSGDPVQVRSRILGGLPQCWLLPPGHQAG